MWESILIGFFLASIPEIIKHRRLGRHIKIENSKEYHDAQWERYRREQEERSKN